MKTTDEQFDAPICPDCDAEYINEIAQTYTNRISISIQKTFDESIMWLEELQTLVRNAIAVRSDDKHAVSLLNEFAILIGNCAEQINQKEEQLISIDNQLTDAFVQDIEKRDNVHLCATCYEQSCDHFEK